MGALFVQVMIELSVEFVLACRVKREILGEGRKIFGTKLAERLSNGSTVREATVFSQ
jgi:hypothetical protein